MAVKKRDHAASLWAHCLSEHGAYLSAGTSLKHLIAYHEHDHSTSGGIRNHPKGSRYWSLVKLRQTISENEE